MLSIARPIKIGIVSDDATYISAKRSVNAIRSLYFLTYIKLLLNDEALIVILFFITLTSLSFLRKTYLIIYRTVCFQAIVRTHTDYLALVKYYYNIAVLY